MNKGKTKQEKCWNLIVLTQPPKGDVLAKLLVRMFMVTTWSGSVTLMS